MSWIPPTFKAVSVIFAVSAVVTGVQAIIDPVGFSRAFGIAITNSKPANESKAYEFAGTPTKSYVSLMGVRQLATGITLLTFAYQGKWNEMATILVILGFVVAGTDGVYLYRSGKRGKGVFHALPGALISLLSGAFVLGS